jgi:hypothetical protein
VKFVVKLFSNGLFDRFIISLVGKHMEQSDIAFKAVNFICRQKCSFRAVLPPPSAPFLLLFCVLLRRLQRLKLFIYNITSYQILK